MTSVKEMLQKGMTPEDIQKQIQNEIDIAQGEIAAEKTKARLAEEEKKKQEAKKSEIEEARLEMLDAMIDYLSLIGVISDDDIDDEDIDALDEILINIEENVDFIKPVLDSFVKFDLIFN